MLGRTAQNLFWLLSLSVLAATAMAVSPAYANDIVPCAEVDSEDFLSAVQLYFPTAHFASNAGATAPLSIGGVDTFCQNMNPDVPDFVRQYLAATGKARVYYFFVWGLERGAAEVRLRRDFQNQAGWSLEFEMVDVNTDNTAVLALLQVDDSAR